MLRRAPTAISLSNRDVIEHLEHIERQKLLEEENVQPIQGQKLPSGQRDWARTVSQAEYSHSNEQNEVTVYEFGKVNQQRMLRANASFAPTPPPGPVADLEGSSRSDSSLGVIDIEFLVPEEALSLEQCTTGENEENLVLSDFVHPSGHQDEKPPFMCHEDSAQPSPNHTFDYRGFVESTVDQSSYFVRQDVSTTRSNETPEVQRLRARVPLPRSPLLRSQGANSPERLMVSLTPRVASYGTPGLLLSQLARRPRRYRPRTISYSFKESEKASAAYEQAQGSDNDSGGSQLPSEPQKSFHEELMGGSSQSALLESNVPPSPPEFTETLLSRRGRTVQASSPQFPLPPPFSAVPRNVSSMPSTPREEIQSRNLSSNLLEYDLPRLHASPDSDLTASSHEDQDPSPGSSSMLRNLAALPFRLISAYRSRSPFQSRFDASGSGRLSPTPLDSQRRGPEGAPPTSARRPFQIYDDGLPASTQPQTPQHLPEARLQSRFHPSYTAPISSRIESPGQARPSTGRRRRTRSDSPAGMDTPGFQGLYGGRENNDDEITFNRAAQRLWSLESARRHGQSISNTPDRETSIANNRGDYR